MRRKFEINTKINDYDGFFICLPLSVSLQKHLEVIRYHPDCRELPVSWLPRDFLHLTVVVRLTNQDQIKFYEDIKVIKKVADQFLPLTLDFEVVSIVKRSLKNPLIALQAKESRALTKMQDFLLRGFKDSEMRLHCKTFNSVPPHVSLGNFQNPWSADWSLPIVFQETFTTIQLWQHVGEKFAKVVRSFP